MNLYIQATIQVITRIKINQDNISQIILIIAKLIRAKLIRAMLIRAMLINQ